MSLLAYLVAPPLALVALSLALYALSAAMPRPLSDRAAFLARLLASWLALCACAAYGVVASIALRCVGHGGLSQWTVARAFKWTMWGAVGVSFDVVEGREHLGTRPAVFVGNHQTELDVLMLGSVFPKYCSVTAKRSLIWVPFLGQFMALSKTVFIDRVNRATALAAFDSAAKTMQRERQSVFIFPEGTRSYSEKAELLPFKKGAFHLAVQAQVPIVPIVVANYSNLLNVRRKIFRGGRIPVKVLRPVETKGLAKEDVDGLTQRVRGMMLEELVRLTEREREREGGVAMPASRAEREVNGRAEVKKEL